MAVIWPLVSKLMDLLTLQHAGGAAVRVPRVPGHPLKFDNGCQAPVLRKALGANKPYFLKNFKFLQIDLHNYFNLHVCLSIWRRRPVTLPIPVVVSITKYH